MLLSKWAVSDFKIQKFIKNQEGSGLIISLLGVKSLFEGIFLLVSIP